jgi:hypothetical protein
MIADRLPKPITKIFIHLKHVHYQEVMKVSDFEMKWVRLTIKVAHIQS